MDEVLIPNDSRHDVASYNIMVNDNEVSRIYQVLSISIHKEMNRIPMAKIVLRDGDAAERKFEISNSNEFTPGNKIKINIGRDGENKPGFAGIIVRQSVKVKENGDGELHIDCRDSAFRMTLGRRSHYFENVKDSEVYDELIGKYEGLSTDVETTSLKHRELVQHHISDWDFMLLRAEANGQLVNVNDGKITIAKPNTKSSPALQVTYGSSLLEFEAEMDARYQWGNVKATAWDYSTQQLFNNEVAESPAFRQQGNIDSSELAESLLLDNYEMHHSGRVSEEQLKNWVEGIMMRSRLAKIRGRAKFSGFTEIKVGDMIKLEGVGDRFKGNALVTAVKQDMGKGMWDTHIQFGLDPTRYAFLHDDIYDKPAAGLVGAIHGLQIGKVVQLENDPDGEDRILVKIPVIDNNAQGIWTRVASLDAGADRGAFFRPEIDDEVIVGFINDDPRDAVLLGMLHSSAKQSPISAKDVNHEKGFTTRSKMHIHFNDDTKTITIDTPAGNSIKLDEQGRKISIVDQNRNEMTMDTMGIVLKSDRKIEIQAGTELVLSGKVSLAIGAPQLSMKADASVSIEAQGSASFKSNGPNIISGTPIKLN